MSHRIENDYKYVARLKSDDLPVDVEFVQEFPENLQPIPANVFAKYRGNGTHGFTLSGLGDVALVRFDSGLFEICTFNPVSGYLVQNFKVKTRHQLRTILDCMRCI